MALRFFYIGAWAQIRYIKDAFDRAKRAKLIPETLKSFDFVPNHPQHDRLNKTKFARLITDLLNAGSDAVLFIDTRFSREQANELERRLAGSGVVHFPLIAPIDQQDECFRAALMMMSTPMWTQQYIQDALRPDDVVLVDYFRLDEENKRLKAELAEVSASAEHARPARQTVSEVLADYKRKYHPAILAITHRAEETASSCEFNDLGVVGKALETLASAVNMRRSGGGSDHGDSLKRGL